MAKKDNRVSPYRSCQDINYVVQENTFTIDESRLETCFGKVYDRAIEKNPPPNTGWRDHFTGAFIASTVSTVYAGYSANAFSWSALACYYVVDILLLILSGVFSVRVVMAQYSRGTSRSVRQNVINEALEDIIEISRRESQ